MSAKDKAADLKRAASSRDGSDVNKPVKTDANVGAVLAQALFAPRSIALVGASGDAGKYSALPQRYLRQHGFTGAIFPVNPARSEVFGEPAFASLDAIAQPIDHAFIMLPARLVPEAVDQCATAGVRCVTILSAGFAEIGDEGRALQDQIVERARRSGMRLLGPNCLGVINTNGHLALSANEALETPRLAPGHISLLSQSGSLLGALLTRGQARGLRFAKMVSVGNEADLGIGELCELLVDDPDTRAILVFLETIRDPKRFAAAARRAFAGRKPIIAYLLGRSPIGNELAASHTGAITGNSAAIEAFLRDNGVICIDMFETLLEMAPFVIGKRPIGRAKVNVMATTGGGGALMVDNLGLRGVISQPPGPAVVAGLAARNIQISDAPLIDLTLAGTNPKIFGAVLNALIASRDNDAIVAVIGSSSQYKPERAVVPLIDRAKTSAKPIAAFLTPDAQESSRMLADASIAVFRTPEACADAVHAFFSWRAPADIGTSAFTASGELLRLARAPGIASAAESAAILDALRIARAKTVTVTATVANDGSDGDLGTSLAGIVFPVAIKIVSPDIAHKTEAGGVMLDVADLAAVRQGLREMLATVRSRRPDARLDGFEIQEMRRGLAEVLLGYRVDPQVGPTIAVGVGGILAEIYRDVVLALAPVDIARARAMIEQVRGLAPIRGYRNLPKGDLDALAPAISAWSQLACLPDSRISEAEINPLIVGAEGEGVVAVDALIARR